MGEVLQTNIFFFITAASVIVLTVFLSIVFFHAIKIVRCVRRIVERVEEGSEVLMDDLHHIRGVVTGTSTMLSHLLGLKHAIRKEREDEDETPKKKGTKLSIKDET